MTSGQREMDKKCSGYVEFTVKIVMQELDECLMEKFEAVHFIV